MPFPSFWNGCLTGSECLGHLNNEFSTTSLHLWKAPKSTLATIPRCFVGPPIHKPCTSDILGQTTWVVHRFQQSKQSSICQFSPGSANTINYAMLRPGGSLLGCSSHWCPFFGAGLLVSGTTRASSRRLVRHGESLRVRALSRPTTKSDVRHHESTR